MKILGLNAYHGDSAACLVVDGKLIAAVEEERFTRIKHWAGFPRQAIDYCLKEGKITLADLDHIALNRNPSANFLKKAAFALIHHPSFHSIQDRFKNASKVQDVLAAFEEEFGVPQKNMKVRVHFIHHHLAHLASAFFVSPFSQSAVVSVDGFGDFESAMWGLGEENKIKILGNTFFPHSLGLFYMAMTQYLGFPNYGDEYKVMGLAPYGNLSEVNAVKKLLKLKAHGQFELALDFFVHHKEGVAMTWQKGEPICGPAYSKNFSKLFGSARKTDEPLTEHHKNLAAALQFVYEEAFFHILNHVHRLTQTPNLALAGGCAMNSVANGKIYANTPFRKLYVQSAAGDAGGAIGSAYTVWNQILKKPKTFFMDHPYWGPEYKTEDFKKILEKKSDELKKENCAFQFETDEKILFQKTTRAIADGKVIGWFDGRMEWGPRALGNRSILCDPRRADMKEILNIKIKRRESFRPFAPSILRDKVSEYFEIDDDVPFMLQVYQIRENKRSIIPAVTHVNGSGRLQTVTSNQNPRYYELIQTFSELTGVPILLNTSFNENEPIVCQPMEALDCFLRTKMDVLVLGNYFIARN